MMAPAIRSVPDSGGPRRGTQSSPPMLTTTKAPQVLHPTHRVLSLPATAVWTSCFAQPGHHAAQYTVPSAPRKMLYGLAGAVSRAGRVEARRLACFIDATPGDSVALDALFRDALSNTRDTTIPPFGDSPFRPPRSVANHGRWAYHSFPFL